MFASGDGTAVPVESHKTPGRRGAATSLLRRWRGNESGNVAMLFGLLVIPLAAMIGLAVDFGHVYKVTSHTQAALDSAALAAGRAAQLNPTDALNKASAAATAYFDEAKPKDVVTSTLQFSPNSSNTQFTVTATSWVKTPFLGVLYSLFHKSAAPGAPAGCQANGFGCVSMTSTATAALCPSQACTTSNSGGSSVEVSLMLDVTGSMCDPCTKIDAAKKAAKDLIDIVVWQDQSQYYSRVALAPFAEAVNVGKTLAPLVRGTVTANSNSGSEASGGPQDFTSSTVLNDPTKQPTKKWIRYTKSGGSGTRTWLISSKCVTERIGTDAYTDAGPAGTSTYVGKAYFGATASSSSPQQDDTSCGVANYTDDEVNSVFPLSSDTTTLKRRIDKLQTAGSTAGHLGTAWAWYLLSPKWNSVFQAAYPSSYAAAPYSDLTVLNSKGMPKLRKIAVLMTDGDYNINYCKGVEAKNSDQTPDINCNSENAKALVQATALCTAMKAPVNGGSIEVFTVGFQVSTAAKTFLKACATDASHYYDATTELALQAAFRDIALKISILR
ncbi:MAG TPA: TadE/TadG family type IV pilus assembly protein, partial [Hyphomicrobiaceae bacterium]|nr:TadE/TadG family type IV pilus assembly protein [Hyphomicrobiaceae bacterium]